MYVYDDYGNHHAQGYQQHGEQKIFAEQWQRQRRRWYDFRYEQEKHGLRQEDCDAQ